jgi:hypothetical protein
MPSVEWHSSHLMADNRFTMIFSQYIFPQEAIVYKVPEMATREPSPRYDDPQSSQRYYFISTISSNPSRHLRLLDYHHEVPLLNP